MFLLQLLRRIILPMELIDKHLPDTGLLYEVGSGYGLIGIFLARSKKERFVICIDNNKEKIRQTLHHKKLINLRAVVSDALTFAYQKCNGVVISDFFHHVPYKVQDAIMQKITMKLNRNGVLIIREIDANDGIRRWFSRFWDLLLYPYDVIYYRTRSDWQKFLANLGYRVSIFRIIPWFPGSAFLYICTKK